MVVPKKSLKNKTTKAATAQRGPRARGVPGLRDASECDWTVSGAAGEL